MILYPEISNIKKSNLLIKMLLLGSIILGIILLILNMFFGQKYHWAYLSIAGIIYTWITVLTAIKKDVNIATHVMLQVIAAFIITVIIDLCIGYKGWSIKLAFPIITLVANTIILLLSLITKKKYLKYIIYQSMIFFVSAFIAITTILNGNYKNALVITSSFTSIIALIITILICRSNLDEQMGRRFHL